MKNINDKMKLQEYKSTLEAFIELYNNIKEKTSKMELNPLIKKYNSLKLELSILGEHIELYKNTQNKIKEIEENPLIKEYNNLQLELSIIADNYNSLRKEYMMIYQSMCPHTQMVIMKKSLIRPKCKCIECGSIESGSISHFKNKIIVSSENKNTTGIRHFSLTNKILNNEFLYNPTANNKILIKTMNNKNNI